MKAVSKVESIGTGSGWIEIPDAGEMRRADTQAVAAWVTAAVAGISEEPQISLLRS